MPHQYLDEFRNRIKSLHDPTGETCHWTSDEEMTTPVVVRGSLGPCTCPSMRPCPQHHCQGCMSTTQVLAIKTEAEDQYAPTLQELGPHMDAVEDAIKSAEEAIRSLMRSGSTYSEALDDSVLTTIMNGHYGHDKPHLEFILNLGRGKWRSMLADDCPPSCTCICLSNKKARLLSERSLVESLIKQATKEGNALFDAYKAGLATFSNTLGRVLSDSLTVVLSALYGDPTDDNAVAAAKDLLQYYLDSRKEGGRLYIMYKAIHELGDISRIAMLGTVYHDQQVLGRTCYPVRATGGDSPKATQETTDAPRPTSGATTTTTTTTTTSGTKTTTTTTTTTTSSDPASSSLGSKPPDPNLPKKTCQTEHPDLETCKELGEDGFGFESSSEDEAAQRALESIRDDYEDEFERSTIELENKKPATSFCQGKGYHYAVKGRRKGKDRKKGKREFIASVITCPCCKNTDTGPTIFWRARIFYEKR